jgi:hypothetical protein
MINLVETYEAIAEIMKGKRVVRVEISKKIHYVEDGITIWEMEIGCMRGEQTLQTYQNSRLNGGKVFYSEQYIFSIKECDVMHNFLRSNYELGRGERLQFVLQLNDKLLVQLIRK